MWNCHDQRRISFGVPLPARIPKTMESIQYHDVAKKRGFPIPSPIHVRDWETVARDWGMQKGSARQVYELTKLWSRQRCE
jgi:hypothetical protein